MTHLKRQKLIASTQVRGYNTVLIISTAPVFLSRLTINRYFLAKLAIKVLMLTALITVDDDEDDDDNDGDDCYDKLCRQVKDLTTTIRVRVSF